MNKPIRRLALFAMALFGVLLLNVTYIQAIQAESLQNHPFNSRQFTDRMVQPRGPIIIGGEKVAYSKKIKNDDKYQRHYENGNLYGHVTGAFTPIGATGLEKADNDLLNGSDDRLVVRNFLDMLTGKEQQGASLELTIQPKAQKAALDGLSATGKRGAAVALDPESGAVLASASLPTYDPGEISSVTNDTERAENYKRLEGAENRPMVNRAFSETYFPGSTFKVVTAAAALEDGATPDSTQEAPDELTLPQGGTLPNAGGGSCNGGSPDTLTHSIEMSCNTSMANWAIDLGEEKMEAQAKKFGFNTPGLEIPTGIATSKYPSGLNGSQLGQTGIGQFDVRATPLQMAMVAGGVANGGDVMKPYLVDEAKAPDLSRIDKGGGETLTNAVSSGTADQLKDMMIGVTEGEDASGPGARIDGMQVAGKTGTAETGEGSNTHNWFISFAPADDPQVAVAVVVENGNSSGGVVAAPIAKSMMEAVITQ